MSSTIYSNGIPIPLLDDSKHFYHNRLTLIIGPSGSGKSALTQHILNSLRNVIPLIIVACPTAEMNGDYNGIVPKQCIYEDLSKPLIQRIFQRQQNVVTMHKMVHDIQYVKPLFNMVSDETSRAKIAKLKEIFNNGCREIRLKLDESDVDVAIDTLKEKYNKKLVKHMREHINKRLNVLDRHKMTDVQRSVVESFNINPSLVLIADDCMATVKEWGPLEETKKLFYQGRHYHLTTIMLCQETTLLGPQLRSNAHITIFTTEQIANGYVRKETSGFSNDEKKKISKMAETIFSAHHDANKPNYKKLVLLGPLIKTDYFVQYIVGSPRKKRFGSSILWKICNLAKQESNDYASGSFNKMFGIKSDISIN